MDAANSYLSRIGMHDTHNLFIDILVGQGLVGILLLCLTLVNFIRVKKRDRQLMIIIVISSFAPLFFINGFNTASFWAPMILCQILSNYSHKHQTGLLNLL